MLRMPYESGFSRTSGNAGVVHYFEEASSWSNFFSVTITSEVYQDITTWFIAVLEKSEFDVVFQQDNVRPHVSTSMMDFLRSFFGERLISVGLWPHKVPTGTPGFLFVGRTQR